MTFQLSPWKIQAAWFASFAISHVYGLIPIVYPQCLLSRPTISIIHSPATDLVWRKSFQILPLQLSSRTNNEVSQQGHTEPQENENDETNDVFTIQLMQLASSHVQSQSLCTFVQLGIPEILRDGPRTMRGIANRIGPTTNMDALYRTLRVLTTIDILFEQQQQQQQQQQRQQGPDHEPTMEFAKEDSVEDHISFGLTKMGKLLLSSSPNSQGLTACIQHWLEEPLWKSWLYVADYIRGTHQPSLPFDQANDGCSSDDYYNAQSHPLSLQHANQFVLWIYQSEINAIVNGYDWFTLANKTVVDIGGHYGHVLGAVRQQYPSVPFRALCLDLPNVIEKAPSPPRGVELIAGTIWDPSTIPSCDVILLKHFLDRCMWTEAETIQILETCYSVLPKDGKVLIGEAILPRIGEVSSHHENDYIRYRSSLSLTMDALYMIVGRERQRTETEWSQLVSSAGFEIEEIRHTPVPSCSILVLRKEATFRKRK